MFNSLTGVLNNRSAESIFLLTGGLEWEIHTTAQSLADMPAEGKEIRIFTYLYHRDDQMRLFGFTSDDERRVFLDLIRVDGVGPRLAIKILSGIKTSDFVRSLEREDLPALTAVPGLGKKTAQKIILSLKGRLLLGEAESPNQDIISALTGMGFDKNASQKAVAAASKQIDPDDTEKYVQEMLKICLKILGTGK